MARHDASAAPALPSFERWCSRHYSPASAVVLALAALNLGYRLNSEVVTEWDESLYALTAWETVEHGRWIGTTFLGSLDYYNSKPPLNVWLIALAFKLFGVGLVPLRMASAISAWLAIAVLQHWSRRCFGPAVALLSGLVLSTTFGFLYVHSGRSGNPDALFSLLVLLTVVTLWAARSHPWRRMWLGPILAAVFLLKGAAVVMPMVIVCGVEWLGRRHRRASAGQFATASLLFLVPVATWGAARWHVDGWRFFRKMLENDLVAVTLTATDGHSGGLLFYLEVLQKNHYDWLAAGLLAVLLFPAAWRSQLRQLVATRDDHRLVVAVWAAVTLLVPTLMQTKLPWYLNAFYPAFALGVGWILARAFSDVANRASRHRQIALAAVAVAAFAVAEGRLIWYSYHARALEGDVQGVILARGAAVAGQRIFGSSWDNADLFVLKAVKADAGVATGLDDFMAKSRAGDYLVTTPGFEHPSVVPVGLNERYALYRRRE